jgi:outer membrane protein OmpA-like peptidoglycan-associated protein
MKYPVNSGGDDFGWIFEKVNPLDKYKIKSQGYFVSNRPGGKGHDDIYRFVEQKVKVYLVKGDVVEKKFEREGDPNSRIIGYTPLPRVEVSWVVSDSSGNIISKAQQTVKSDTTGSFRFIADAEKIYRISAARTDYFSKSEQASTMGFLTIEKDTITATVRIILDRIYKDVQVNISNIYYDYNKANIRADAALVLDTLVTLLKENPTVKVEIGSHTDSRGKDAYNMRLSQSRAQSVVDYLIKNGIDAQRLTAKGYGESQLTNDCDDGKKCTEEQHQANRRTTFKVLSEAFSIESKEPEKIIQDPNKNDTDQ